MKKKKILRGVLAGALLFPLGMMAYQVTTAEKKIVVEPVTESIFRVTVVPKDSAKVYKESQSVVLKPEKVSSHTHDMESEFIIETATTTIEIDKKTGAISFYNSDDSLIFQEASPIDNESAVKKARFIMPNGEYIYGAGERGHSLALNGDSLSFYNRQNYGYTEGDSRISQMGISVPWIVNDAGTGILFDDYKKAGIVIADTIEYSSETPDALTYYLVNGDNLADASSKYAKLTGNQGLPPLWSLGYITSKYGYHTQDEALGVIDTLKTRGYPVDGLVLDLYWYGVETDMGRLAWNRKQWPQPKKMLNELKEMGVNTVLITQPYINKIGAIDNYNTLDSLGLLTKDASGKTNDVTTWVGEAGMFDMANPKTREWLWNRLRQLTRDGVAGWWGDLGEPEVHPETIVHANGETAQQFHNAYGNVWSKLIYDGLRKDFPDMRPLLMMRGGTTGLQRYGVMPWTTDVSRSWGGLQPQIKLMLSSGLSGLGYMSSDIGGFAVDPENPTDPELYVRWLEMGAFTPTLRTHAQLKPEPYHYPEYEEISKRYIKMRYEWLPYNYTLAYENSAYGLPLARPLNFRGDNPGEKYASIDNEYMWGDEVLVAPVMKQGATGRDVTFPAGQWIDYFDPSVQFPGDTTAYVEAPLDKLPLFVKKGSFIPLYTKEINNVTEYNPQYVTVKYYPSEETTSYTLFDDDRLSPTSLEDDAYQLTTFTGRQEGKNIDISIETNGGKYRGMPYYRHLTFEIDNVDKPKEVNFTSHDRLQEKSLADLATKAGWNYDKKTRKLVVSISWPYQKNDLKIRF